MSVRIQGDWSSFDFTLTPQAKDVFETVLSDFLGVTYTPFAFASQTVTGTNYAFLCDMPNAKDYPPENIVIVRVFHPSQGKPCLVSIIPVHP